MEIFLKYEFLFLFGGILGFIGELLFNKIVNKEWVNPGFFVGPWVPIYGFGIIIATLIYNINLPIILLSIISGLIMNIIELIGGIILEKKMKVRLWDYSNMFLNYKGYICFEFTLLWIIVSYIFFSFFEDRLINFTNYVVGLPNISFLLGILLGLLIIDALYSFNVLLKLKEYAKNKQIIVKYEDLKLKIKKKRKEKKQKVSFVFPFKHLFEHKKEKK